MTWKDVVDFESRYEVSDEGHVRNKQGRLIAVHSVRGYAHVMLFKDGRQFNRYIHRLVLEAFIGPSPPGHECCHRDNDRMNCAISNLYWGTKVHNAKDKDRHGSSPKLDRNPRTHLSRDQVIQIYRRSMAGEAQKNLAREFGVSVITVSHIKCGRTWGELTGATHIQGRAQVTPQLIQNMKQLRKSGLTLQQVADATGVSKPTVFRNTKGYDK